MAELHELTIAQGASLLARRALSPREWTEALLVRIGTLDGQVNAFIAVTAELAREEAARAEKELMASRARGPLHGVPLAMKDVLDTAGVATTGHSRVGLGRVPVRDATAVGRLRQGGAVLLGKLATHEFAHGGPSLDLPWPPARNPWNPEHFAGSSSSGSGAAVAAGFVPGSLGTDTGGSIRIPAGMCGVAGLKPTYGLVSRAGVLALSPSLDTCGPLARTCEDCAMLLQQIAGHDPADPSSANQPVPDYRAALTDGLVGVRIGVVRHFWERDLNAAEPVRRAMTEALDTLRRLGATLHETELLPLLAYNDVRVVVQEPEAFAIHQEQLMRDPGAYGEDFLGRILGAVVLSGSDHVQAGRERRRLLDGMLAVFRDVDVLVTAGAGPAPRFDAPGTFGFIHGLWGRPNITSPFSVTGVPALAVPIGFTEAGLPLSMQIAAPPFRDGQALRIGHAYERAAEWHTRRPKLEPGKAAPVRLAPAAAPPPVAPGLQDFVDACLQRAGLRLSAAQRALAYQAAPHALATAARIPSTHPWAQEAANQFRLEPWEQQ